jgi:hypothetical protein
MFKQRTVTTTLGVFALVLSTGTARAYCRSTTADPRTEAVETDADGCTTSGFPLYWKSRCVGIHADEAASEYVSLSATRRLLANAFAEWKAANGMCTPSIDVLQLSPVSSPKIDSQPAENDVLFHDRDWPYLGKGQTLELVSTIFRKENGELLDADMEFNGEALALLLHTSDGGTIDAADSTGIQRIFIHAAGHFLGFGHSADPRSIMYSLFTPNDPTVPALTDDDAAGMCDAYPETGDRPTVDGRGNPTSVPSTACNLSTLSAASPCSAGGAIKLDHGCSIALGRRASSAGNAALVLAALGLCAVRLRRRQSLPVRTTQ